MKYTFETALVYLKQGKKIRRAAWPEHYCYIRFAECDGEVGIEMVTNLKRGYWYPREAWHIQDYDILAEDWEVVE